jgi:hypothetical protein
MENHPKAWVAITVAIIIAVGGIIAAYISNQPNEPNEIEATQTVVALQQTQSALGRDSTAVPPLVGSQVTVQPTTVTMPTPGQSRAVPQLTSRGDGLAIYDEIYSAEGWCAVWDQLVEDGLVTGNCPDWTGKQPAYESVSTSNGTASLFSGIEVTATSDVRVNFPTCINFEPPLVEYSNEGVVVDWEPPTQTGTNFTVSRGSIFSIYFRCDHIYANLFFDN